MIEGLKDSPISSLHIHTGTRRDFILFQVLQCVQQVWPTVVTEELKPYWNRRLELSLYDGCPLWGSGVIVLPPGRNQELSELHGGHPGCVRMKSVARMFRWWPEMDVELEYYNSATFAQFGIPKTLVLGNGQCFVSAEFVECLSCNGIKCFVSAEFEECLSCNGIKHFVSAEFVECLSCNGIKCFVSAEFVECLSCNGIKRFVSAEFEECLSCNGIKCFVSAECEECLSCNGIKCFVSAECEECLSCNGIKRFVSAEFEECLSCNGIKCFVSAEFEECLSCNGIKHLKSAPYHPASSGLTERAMQIFK